MREDRQEQEWGEGGELTKNRDKERNNRKDMSVKRCEIICCFGSGNARWEEKCSSIFQFSNKDNVHMDRRK